MLFFRYNCHHYSSLYHSFTTAAATSIKPAPLSALPSTSMRAWCIQDYKKPLVRTEMLMPKMKRDDQVILRVLAASLNPIDIRICQGYGRKLLALQAQMGWNDGTMPDPRRVLSALTRQTSSPSLDERFPLIPGRDCSAEVIEIGPRVQGIEIGDQVIAVIPPEWQGTHADYVVAPAYAIAPKPVSLEHTEAAALPYVACTAWAALVATARIRPENAQGLRILIHGGAGGVGTIAIQMLKCWGAKRIVATCSKEKIDMVEKLGAKAIDYRAEDAKVNLIANGPYDVVLDCVDSELATWSEQILGIWRNCLHVTLNSPLLADIDRYGLAMGAGTFGAKMICRNVNGPIRKGQLYLPAFFSPSQECLNWISQAASDGRIQPVIDEVFPFAKLPDAFEKVSQMHGKGKTIIDFGSIQST